MGRWSHLDTDEERLPEGMKRVGYDADTQVYTYRDTDGSEWEGAPGVKYGKLYRVRAAAPALPSVYITGHQDPFNQVLHDYDPGDSNDSDSVDSDNHTLTDEKHTTTTTTTTTTTPSYPDKAVLRTSIKRKPVPNQPTNTTTTADTDADAADRLSLASTLVDRLGSIRSHSRSRSTTSATTTTTTTTSTPPTTTPTNPLRRQQQQTSSLRRTGTLTRLARFLGSSASAAGLARRATVGSGVGQNGQWPGSGSRSGQAGGNGNGNGAGSARAARARKRATTFDEILGEGQ